MTDYKIIIAQRLLQIKAINLNINEPYTWASGIKSPIYCDNRLALSDIETRNIICSAFVEAAGTFLSAGVIAGVATGGIAHGMLVADRMQLPFIYVRTANKGHGLKNAVEGRLIPGQKVLVIEDLVSTGGSSYQAIESLQEAGGEVVGLISIFNYGFEETEHFFAAKKIPIATLTDYKTLITIATQMGIVTKTHEKTLMDWRRQPKNWPA